MLSFRRGTRMESIGFLVVLLGVTAFMALAPNWERPSDPATSITVPSMVNIPPAGSLKLE